MILCTPQVENQPVCLVICDWQIGLTIIDRLDAMCAHTHTDPLRDERRQRFAKGLVRSFLYLCTICMSVWVALGQHQASETAGANWQSIPMWTDPM